jgi:hypothetical protein
MSGGRFAIELTRSEIEDLKLEQHYNVGDCQWVSDKIDHLHEVIGRAISYEQVAVSTIELLNAIFPCIIVRDDYHRWNQILSDALVHAQNLKDNEFQMQLWTDLGQNYLQLGLGKEAYEAFTMASERGEDFKAPEMALRGKIGQLLTQAIFQKGHYKDLIPEILTLAKQVDQPELYALTHYTLARGYILRHETQAAFEHAQIAYIWWHKVKDYAQKADTAMLMAQACRLESQIEQAMRYLKLGEDLIQSPDHQHQLALSDYETGTVELEERQNPGEAEKWYLAVLERLNKLDYPYLTAVTHHALGITQTKLGKFSEARSHLKTANCAWKNLNSGLEQASVCYAIGFLAFKQHKIGSALWWYNQSLKMLEQIADSPSRKQLEERLQEDIETAKGCANKPAELN